MEWYPCSVCGLAHPWPRTEKPCPNEGIVERTGLTGVKALEAAGLFNREVLNKVLAGESNKGFDRVAYMREYMARRRELAKRKEK